MVARPTRDEGERGDDADRVDGRGRRVGGDRGPERHAPDALGEVAPSEHPLAAEPVAERRGDGRQEPRRHEQQDRHDADGAGPTLVVGVDEDRDPHRGLGDVEQQERGLRARDGTVADHRAHGPQGWTEVGQESLHRSERYDERPPDSERGDVSRRSPG